MCHETLARNLSVFVPMELELYMYFVLEAQSV